MLPAYAGMIPVCSVSNTEPVCAPRVCGDDPAPYRLAGACMTVFVLPAYAGMIPRPRPGRHQGPRAPRVCGDDPGAERLTYAPTGCSPRMRG